MNNTAEFAIADWDAYSGPFTSVMPRQMLDLNQEVASHLYGNVVDFGCGGGKIIPFLLTNEAVKSYTGVDSSVDMIKCANWMASQYPERRSVLIHRKIEDVSLKHIDSALSVNSYYVWRDPEAVLRHIVSQLPEGGRFVLATINPLIDMPALLAEAEKELIAHPHWAEFKRHNLGISQHEDANFVTLDTLIGQVKAVGLKVQEAHQRLYEGGLNVVVCDKC